MKRTNEDILRFINNYPSAEGEDEQPQGISSLGVKVVDDFFVIDDIKKRPYPGENSRNHSEYDVDRNQREERITRLDILSKHPYYRTLKLIAGAMQNTSVEELFDHDDLERELGEQNRALSDRYQSQENVSAKKQALLDQMGTLRLEQYYLKSGDYKQLEAEVGQLRRELGSYDSTREQGHYGFVQLLEMWGEYDMAIGVNRPSSDAGRIRLFLEQYERDYEKLVSISEQLKGYSVERLREMERLALYIRDDMDLDRHSHDERTGASFTDSIRHKIAASAESVAPEPVSGVRIKREDPTPPSLRTLRVKRESFLREDKNLAKVIVIEDDAPSQPLVIHGSLLDTVQSGMIRMAMDATVRGKEPVTASNKDVSYTEFVMDYIEARSKHNFARVVELNSAILPQTIYTIHPPALNKLIAEAREKGRDNLFDKTNVMALVQSYYLHLYLTKTPITDIYKQTEPVRRQLDASITESLAINFIVLGDSLELIRLNIDSTLKNIEENHREEDPLLSSEPQLAPERRIRDEGFREYHDYGRLPLQQASRLPLVPVVSTLPSLEAENVWGGAGTIVLLERAKLWLDYAAYQRLLSDNREQRLTQLQRNLELLVYDGGEGGRRHPRNDPPINSGVVALNSNVLDKIDEAYQLVQRWCPDLERLPRDAFFTASALESGLAGDFARFVAVLDADGSMLHPDQYKSGRMMDKVLVRKGEMMRRLQQYGYRRRPVGAVAQPEDYVIYQKEKRVRGPGGLSVFF